VVEVKAVITVFGTKGVVEHVEGFLEKLAEFSKSKNVVAQVFNADMVYGENHLLSAAEHAIRAFRENTNVMRTLSMEVVLYAAGERQIGTALSKIGVTQGEGNYVFLIISSTPEIDEAKGSLKTEDVERFIREYGMERDDSVLEGNENTLRRFGLSDEEIRTVEKDKYEDLILEKVAMVDVIK